MLQAPSRPHTAPWLQPASLGLRGAGLCCFQACSVAENTLEASCARWRSTLASRPQRCSSMLAHSTPWALPAACTCLTSCEWTSDLTCSCSCRRQAAATVGRLRTAKLRVDPGLDHQSQLQEAGSYYSMQIAHWTCTETVARHRSGRQFYAVQHDLASQVSTTAGPGLRVSCMQDACLLSEIGCCHCYAAGTKKDAADAQLPFQPPALLHPRSPTACRGVLPASAHLLAQHSR